LDEFWFRYVKIGDDRYRIKSTN